MHCNRHLGGYLRAVSNAMAQNLQQNSEELGLTSMQSMFLHHLWVRKEKMGLVTYAKDLEDFFDIKHSTVSGILQRFVEFQASAADRRCKAVCMTQKSLDALEQIGARIQQTEQKLVSGMTEDEVQEFRRLLQLAANNLGVCMPEHKNTKPKEEAAL